MIRIDRTHLPNGNVSYHGCMNDKTSGKYFTSGKADSAADAIKQLKKAIDEDRYRIFEIVREDHTDIDLFIKNNPELGL